MQTVPWGETLAMTSLAMSEVRWLMAEALGTAPHGYTVIVKRTLGVTATRLTVADRIAVDHSDGSLVAGGRLPPDELLVDARCHDHAPRTHAEPHGVIERGQEGGESTFAHP